MLQSPFSEAASYLDDFHERRELQGLGDSDGLGSDPTLEPPSLAPPVFVELVNRRHKRECDVWNASPPWDCTCGLLSAQDDAR